MGNEKALARVEEDLRAGHTFLAVQRLTTLVQAAPADLELRERLAAVHLATGNWVQAGLWSYLSEDPDPRAFTAFERAFPHPRARLEALRWRSLPQPLPPRLAQLEALAGEAARMQPQVHRSWRDSAWLIGWAVFAVLNLGIYVVGLVMLVRLAV